MSLLAKSVETIRAFVPAQDFALSKRFYADLGFELGFENDQLAVFSLGETSFYLQNHTWDGASENFVMLLRVNDLELWWTKVEPLAAQYGVRVRPPKDEPWGAREIHLLDPTGVLWHIARFHT